MPWAVSPTLEGTLAHTRDDVRDWSAERHYQFASIERSGGVVLGVAGLDAQEPDAPELHYWIRSDHAGRGLTTEACGALVRWAKEVLHVTRLTLWAGRDNLASRRVAEKLGFQYVGPLDWRPEGGMGNFDAESYELELGS